MSEVSLTDVNKKRITTIPVDFYSPGNNVEFACYLYNSAAYTVQNLMVATEMPFVGVIRVSISGGEYVDVTANWENTCVIGDLGPSAFLPVNVLINVPISAGLSGFNVAPLYISRA